MDVISFQSILVMFVLARFYSSAMVLWLHKDGWMDGWMDIDGRF